MANPFASVTRVALEDMVRMHGTESKFGLFFPDDAVNSLVDELVRFLETSRSLKAAGDRFLATPSPPKADLRRSDMRRPLRTRS